VKYRYWPIVGIVKLGPFLCIVTTLANFNGLGNSALDMRWLKICVSEGAITGAAIFSEFGTDLVRSRLFIYIYFNE